ncbi:MAG: PIN domain-containing protein [Candidatus Parabeggiatoa sp.]|nr:PIN domain-containing protein [Candidatus Parabeggiatoa sp.]
MKNDTPTNNKFVTDTMAMILRLEKRKMSQNAKSLFQSTEAGETFIYIPSMVFAEILYLSEKNRIKASLDNVENYLKQYPHFQEYPLTFSVLKTSAKINDIPERHDRLIAATALSLNLALITNDPIIEASAFVHTVW